MKDVTIFDIAKMLGISPSTVSRALNNYLHTNRGMSKEKNQGIVHYTEFYCEKFEE